MNAGPPFPFRKADAYFSQLSALSLIAQTDKFDQIKQAVDVACSFANSRVVRFSPKHGLGGLFMGSINITFDAMPGYSVDVAGLKKLKFIILPSGLVATTSLNHRLVEDWRLCNKCYSHVPCVCNQDANRKRSAASSANDTAMDGLNAFLGLGSWGAGL